MTKETKDLGAAPPRSLTDSDLEDLERALRAATPAPWRAATVVALRNAAPSLISDLRSARKLLGEAQNGLRNVLCVSLPVDVSGERMVQIARDALAALDAFLRERSDREQSSPPDYSAALLEARKMLSEQELKELERALRAASPEPWTVAFSNTTIRPEIHAPLPVGGTPSDAHSLRVAALTTSEDAAAIAALRNSASSLISASRALLEARRMLGEAEAWLDCDPGSPPDLVEEIRAFLRSDSERSEPARSESGGSKVVHDPSEEER